MISMHNVFSMISKHNVLMWSSSLVISDSTPPHIMSYSEFMTRLNSLRGLSRVIVIGTPSQITENVALEILRRHHPFVTHVICGNAASLDTFMRTFLSEIEIVSFSLMLDDPLI